MEHKGREKKDKINKSNGRGGVDKNSSAVVCLDHIWPPHLLLAERGVNIYFGLICFA